MLIVLYLNIEISYTLLFGSNIDENDIIEQNNIKYASFDDAQKWMLNSGRKIEDVVHDFATKCKNERNAHSCIMYPTDPTWKQLNVLTEQELKEISTY
jgi:hypothetical protein